MESEVYGEVADREPRDRLALPRVLADWATRTPDKTYLIEAESGRAITYREAHDESVLWAQTLRTLKVSAADTVLTVLNWRTDAVTLWCGIAYLGAVDVTVNPAMRGRALIHQVNLTRAALAVTDNEGLQLLQSAKAELRHLRTVILLPGSSDADDDGWTVLKAEDVMGRVTDADRGVPLTPPALRDVARLTFTSGTTGPSKAVVLPWGSLVQGALASKKPDYTSDEVFYITSPANHVTGRMLTHLTAILGATGVLRPHFRTPNFWLDVHTYGATMTTLVAAMANFVNDQPPTPQDADNTLKYVNMVPIHPDHEAFAKRFGVKITSGYGQSEAIKVLSYGWEIEDIRGAGRPDPGWPGIQLRIVDEDDYEVSDGEIGELIVRSDTPWTMNLGYFDDPAATAEGWRNGWFHTGDMFQRDERGIYFFVDRARDAIRRRGVNIASFDVEAEVNAHPDVVESAAVAVKVGENEEEIKVFVVLRDGVALDASDLVAFVRDSAPSYMVPRFVQIIDALPRNESQRVQKFALRAASRDGEFDAAAV